MTGVGGNRVMTQRGGGGGGAGAWAGGLTRGEGEVMQI